MEMLHALEILKKVRRLIGQWVGNPTSLFDLLREAQDSLSYSDSCRQLALRFIVRANDFTSLSAWEHGRQLSQYDLYAAVNNAVKEISSTDINPYKGFIFCSCVQVQYSEVFG